VSPYVYWKSTLQLSHDGYQIFEEPLTAQVFFKVITGYRPTVPQDMPQGYATLMKACWHEQPEERPPFEDMVAYLRRYEDWHTHY
jgi:hypothetical protein